MNSKPNTKPKTITISASDVAACIGKNPYKSPDEIRTKILAKYGADKTVKTKEQEVEELLATHADAQSLLAAITESAGVESAASVRQHVKEKLQSLQVNCSEEERKQIEKYMYSKAATMHGTKSEDRTADCLGENGENITRDDSFYTHPLVTFTLRQEDIRFQIVGKIDRMKTEADGSKTIIEIKNRVRGLFGKVKEYEEIQVQTYMQLVGVERAQLIEQDQSTKKMNSYNLVRDREWWSKMEQEVIAFCEMCMEKICM